MAATLIEFHWQSSELQFGILAKASKGTGLKQLETFDLVSK